MKRRLLHVPVLCLMFAAPLVTIEGSECYVRAGATGNHDGSDWNNAWTTIPESLERGITCYVADGIYPAVALRSPVSGTQSIIIRKATTQEHGTQEGWVDSYGDGQAEFPKIEIWSSYWEIDGVRRLSPTSGHGFRIVVPGDQGSSVTETGISVRGGLATDRIDGIRVSYVEFTCGIGDFPEGRQYRLKAGYYHPYGGDNTYIGYCYFHHLIGSMQKTGKQNGIVIEHNHYEDNKSYPDGSHGDAVQLWGLDATEDSIPSQNCVVRYNHFRDIDGTAPISFAWGSRNMRVYGNVFSYSEDTFQTSGGIIYVFKGYIGPIYAYNNTIIDGRYPADNGLAGHTSLYIADSAIPQTTELHAYNNLWFRSPRSGVRGFLHHGSNFFGQSGFYGRIEPDPSDIVSQIDPFTDSSRWWNLQLSGPLGPGKNLSEESWWDPRYDSSEDPSGSIRGVDGVWDIGAYEYVANDNQPPVMTPIGPKSIPVGLPLQFQVNATDPDGDPLIFSATGE